MVERERTDVSDGVSWYCPRCYTRKTICEGSFFAKSYLAVSTKMASAHEHVGEAVSSNRCL